MKIFADTKLWKDISGYENIYQVSTFGNIKRINTGRILKPSKDNKGYLRVNLSKEGVAKTFLVHQLVAIEFIPNPLLLDNIDHINTVAYDNRVENLRWVTYKENNNNELTKIKNSIAKTGKNHPLYGKHHKEQTIYRMINSSNEKIVLQYNFSGEFIKEWRSINSIEKEIGYNHSNICSCCNGKRKSAYGYIWRYKI